MNIDGFNLDDRAVNIAIDALQDKIAECCWDIYLQSQARGKKPTETWIPSGQLMDQLTDATTALVHLNLFARHLIEMWRKDEGNFVSE